MKLKGKSLLAMVLVMFTVIFIVAAAGAWYYLQYQTKLNIDKASKDLSDAAFGWKFPVTKFPEAGTGTLLAYSNIRDPGGVPQGLPVRLKIPSIGVNSAIEDALITPDGRMDITAGSVNVAWFARGPHPGNEGSAVIAGHFGVENGRAKVFLNLSKLKAGDKVYVENDKGDTLAFIVRRTQSFDRNGDSTTVFTSSDGKAHLNLITCEGIWNQVNDSYPQRTVVFTDSIPGEGAVAVAEKPKLPEAAKTKPKSSSSPVLAKTPSPTPTETPSPTSPSPSTTPTPTPGSVKNTPAFSQTLIASAKSLYATPIDGIVTTFFVISIFYIAFRIIRR